MNFDYPHTHSIEEALERLAKLGLYLNNRHGIAVEWNEKTCTVKGKYLMVSIEGSMQVESDNVHFDGRDPGMLWRKKAIKYLKDKLEFYLDSNNAIVDLPIKK